VPSERGFVRYPVELGVTIVVLVVVIVLITANGWREMDQWSPASQVLGFVVVIGMFVMLTIEIKATKPVPAEWFETAANLDSTLKPPPARPMRETLAWGLGGSIPGMALGIFVLRDPLIGHILGLPAFILLPCVGWFLGSYLSPEMRADRDYRRRVAAAYARQRETPEERYQRELASSDWQKTQVQWRQRVYEALVWWSSQGEKLSSDSDYLLVLVRERRSDYPSYESILAKYQNPDDPCSTPRRAEQVATWALANLPDLISEHVAQVSERTVPGLTTILRHHHKRDIVIVQERKVYELNQGVEALRGESAEHLVQRLLKEFDGIAIAREKGTKRIQDVAATLEPDARGEYIQTASAGVNALLDAWMFARTKADG
jgi:hypothetical protein